MVEQRIAGHRHQYGIALRRAEQLEEQRIGLARAGGEDDALRSGVDATAGIVTRDCAARLEQAERRRLVSQGLGR